MNLVLSGLWPALAAAGLLGLAAGWFSGLPRDRIAITVACLLALAAAMLGALAVTQRAPGIYGLWVETASLMLAAYLSGCVVGGAARAVRRERT